MLKYLSADIICSEKWTVFARGKLWASTNKYCSRTNIWAYFQSQMEAIVFIINIFRNTGAGSASLSYVNHVKDCQLAAKIHTSLNIQISVKSKACVWGKSTTLKKINTMKDETKIQVADKVTGNLTTFREQDQSEKSVVNFGVCKMCKPRWTKHPAICRSGPFISCSIGALLYIENTIVELTSRKWLPTGHNRMLHMTYVRCAGNLWLKKARLNLQSKTTPPVGFAGFPSERYLC